MKTLRTIHAQAPTRIDLAGGTLDIWPIYLFLNQATTINLAINLFAKTQLEEIDQPGVWLKSQDQGQEIHFSWDQMLHSPTSIQPPPTLELHFKYLQFFLKKKINSGRFIPSLGVRITTQAQSPAGAGLGGSSTLSVSIIGALKVWYDGKLDVLKEGADLVEITRDVETTVIQVPAGMQDYYGAMFGGLQKIHWKAGAHERSGFDSSLLSELSSRLVLFYSGQSRNSGINNWALFKAFIDQHGEVREQFQKINQSTHKLEKAFLQESETTRWAQVGAAIQSEWNTRKNLASGISTTEIDQAFKKAFQMGASAGKICGAGGGGCFFIYLPQESPSIKEALIRSITASTTIQHLPFAPSPEGLQVTISD